MKEETHKLLGIAGFVLLTISGVLAIGFHYPHFYSFFIVGSWLLFDYLNCHFTNKSLLSLLFSRKHFSIVLFTYSFYFLAGLAGDLILGQRISKVWVYPSYTGVIDWLLLSFVIYPIGGFAVIELYQLTAYFITKRFGKGNFWNINLSLKTLNKLMTLLYTISPFLVFGPLINYFIFANAYGNYAIGFGWLGIWLFIDSISYFNKGKVLLIDFINGKKKVWISIIITTLLYSFAYEFLNVFAREWRYQNLPVIDFAILNIPVIVFIGSLTLIIAPVATYNMVCAIKNYKG